MTIYCPYLRLVSSTCFEIQNNHYGPPRTMLLVGKTNQILTWNLRTQEMMLVIGIFKDLVVVLQFY